MDSNSRDIVGALLRERARALEFVVAAVVLAIGTNLLASTLSENLSPGWPLAAGLVLTLVGAGYVMARAVGGRPVRRRFQAFVLYSPRENALTAQDFRYDFGRSLHQYFQAAFFENPAIKAAWDREPLTALIEAPDSLDESRPAGVLPPDPRLFTDSLDVTYTVVHVPELNTIAARAGLDLLIEASEYFVLAHLSRHLADYFERSSTEHKVFRVSRNDIPHVLLENRFLRIFSEPMSERSSFIGSENVGRAGVRSARAPGGALFEHFELVLPKNSTSSRREDGAIALRTRRFAVEIRARCDGYVTPLSPLYMHVYLGLDDPAEPRLVELEVRTRPGRLAALVPWGWVYYRWLDSWLAALPHAADFQVYLSDIGWEPAQTMILAGRHRDSPHRATESKKQPTRKRPR